ncbi:tetratricopeptide repeat protein [Uliginosibacterium gangwonense]|uniref:tetratricopeptide repeat protein n=1 Tax=Uliginosibacterium gangwonense TaxID=392736 RepID=UPI000382CBED|nr:tetratricopeptide repeat protein [Uliginosibacterium gangwonense]
MSIYRFVASPVLWVALAMGMAGCSTSSTKQEQAQNAGLCFRDSCCNQAPSLAFMPHRLRCEALGAEKMALWAEADRNLTESIRLARAATGEQARSGAQVLCLSLTDIARVGDAQGKLERAVNQYDEAVHVCQGAYGDKSSEFARAQVGLANARIDSGRLNEADVGLQNLLEIARLHEDKELRSAALDAAGRLEDKRGDHSKARSLLKQALELRQQVFGERSIEASHSMVHLGDNAMLLRGWSDARGWYLRAIDVIEQSAGKRNRYYFNAKSALAAAYMHDKRYESLPPVYEDLLKLSRELFGTQSEEYAGTLNDAAALQYMQKQYAPAFDRFRQVVDIRRTTMPGSLLLGWTDLNAAKAKLEISSCGPARPYLQEAQDILKRQVNSKDPELADYVMEYQRVSQLCLVRPDANQTAPGKGRKKR